MKPISLLILSAIIAAVPASAQEFYADKTVTIYSGHQAGSLYDTNARFVARFLNSDFGKELRQQSKTGAVIPKLSKQTLAPSVDIRQPATLLLRALVLLQQNPPIELADYDLTTIWDWALDNWDVSKLHGVRTLMAD